MQRGIPLSIHSALEIVAAPAIMAAPFVLGFGQAATAICFLVGVLVGVGIAQTVLTASTRFTLRLGT